MLSSLCSLVRKLFKFSLHKGKIIVTTIFYISRIQKRTVFEENICETAVKGYLTSKRVWRVEISTFFVSFPEYMNFTRQKRSQNVNVSLHRKSSIQNVKVGTCIDRIILGTYMYLLTHTLKMLFNEWD